MTETIKNKDSVVAMTTPFENPPTGKKEVRSRVFYQTVAKVREAFSDLDPEALQELVDEAVSTVRKEMTAERQQVNKKD